MKKLMLSLVLIFLLPLSTFRVYSYYEDINVNTITDGNNIVIISQEMKSEDGSLVPTGAILGVGDVEEITFNYTIFVQSGLEMDYSINDIMINGELVSTDLEDLFNFEFDAQTLEYTTVQTDLLEEGQDGFFVEVTVTLSMEFPTEEQFYLIAGQELSFGITFEGTENQNIQ